jgi:hypothetical protein
MSLGSKKVDVYRFPSILSMVGWWETPTRQIGQGGWGSADHYRHSERVCRPERSQLHLKSGVKLESSWTCGRGRPFIILHKNYGDCSHVLNVIDEKALNGIGTFTNTSCIHGNIPSPLILWQWLSNSELEETTGKWLQMNSPLSRPLSRLHPSALQILLSSNHPNLTS